MICSVPSSQGIDLLAAVRLAAEEGVIEQGEGQRVPLKAGDSAPYDGALLSEEALELIRTERESLMTEVDALRSALAASQLATDTAQARSSMWEAEARGTGWDRATSFMAKYGWAAMTGVALGLYLSDGER